MIPRADADRLQRQLLAVLAEDSHNARRLAERLDALARESGVGAYAAVLLILTRYSFREDQAQRHWDAILAHQMQLRDLLGREVAIRVAALDHFINVNRQHARPALIELTLRDEEEGPSPVDPLTGLLGDRAFRAALQAEIRRARRYRQRVSIALFDLDHFSAVNAAVGDLVGDRVLRDAAILLRNKVRDIDLAARTKEDELAVILPETERTGALLVAERFRQELDTHFAHRDVAGTRVALTVSAGVACYPEDASTAEALLERTAQALYQAKAAGKNNVRTYRPEWRRFLRIDLEAGRFEVEVLAPREVDAGRARNLGRTAIVFGSPEPLEVGEEIEIRLVRAEGELPAASPRIRGRVVRVEELPRAKESDSDSEASESLDRFEIGMAFDADWGPADQEVLEFFEQAQPKRAGTSS